MGQAACDPAALRRLMEQSAGSLELAFRPMFGGIMGYVAGRPFASLSDMGLALKLGAEDRDRLLAAGGVALRYEPEAAPSRSYTVLPAAMLVVGDDLSGWIACSAAHVAAMPAKPPRRAKATAAGGR